MQQIQLYNICHPNSHAFHLVHSLSFTLFGCVHITCSFNHIVSVTFQPISSLEINDLRMSLDKFLILDRYSLLEAELLWFYYSLSLYIKQEIQHGVRSGIRTHAHMKVIMFRYHFDVSFIVIDSKSVPILGLATSESLNIIKRISAVNITDEQFFVRLFGLFWRNGNSKKYSPYWNQG